MQKILLDKKRFNTIVFLGIWGIITIGLFMRFFEWKANSYNTSILAISYNYGFTSRGFIGTIYRLLGNIFNVNIWTYSAAFKFYMVCTLMCYTAFAIIMLLFLRKTSDEYKKRMQYLIIIFTICFVSMFVTEENFGRIDMFMLLTTLMSVFFVVKDKYIWMVIPLTALGVLFHQGYVFTFYNVVLFMLIYRALSKEGSQRRKYIIVLVLSLVICGIFFFWFQVVYRGGAYNYFEEVKWNATLMGIEGKPHEELIRAEILGVNLHDEELKYRIQNIIEIILIIILFIPYILFLMKTVVRIVKKQKDKMHKLMYLAILLGPLTTLPLYFFKVDFGRWTFSVISYFLLVFMAMYCLCDNNIVQSVEEGLANIKTKVYRPFAFVLPLLVIPFKDIAVSDLTERICFLLESVMRI